jgi:hypothetical protein
MKRGARITTLKPAAMMITSRNARNSHKVVLITRIIAPRREDAAYGRKANYLRTAMPPKKEHFVVVGVLVTVMVPCWPLIMQAELKPVFGIAATTKVVASTSKEMLRVFSSPTTLS